MPFKVVGGRMNIDTSHVSANAIASAELAAERKVTRTAQQSPKRRPKLRTKRPSAQQGAARPLGAKATLLQKRKRQRETLAPNECADNEIQFHSDDGAVSISLTPTRAGLLLQRTQRRPLGTQLLQTMLFDDSAALTRWCDNDPVRFDHPLIAARMRSGGEAMLNTGKTEPADIAHSVADIALADRMASATYASSVCAAVRSVASAPDMGEVMVALHHAVTCLGADAAVFTSFTQDDANNAMYRCLLVGDAEWGAAQARDARFLADPWLHHASHSMAVVLGSELPLISPHQLAYFEAAKTIGFASSVIVPTHSPAGTSKVGILSLGSRTTGYFEQCDYGLFAQLAQSLAMELYNWWHKHLRQRMLMQLKLTEDDLALLRFEQQGLCSKSIARAMGTLPRTIDCRFQRLSSRMGMANRRSALRFAELYGLISAT
jgi:Autoinducer binding domain